MRARFLAMALLVPGAASAQDEPCAALWGRLASSLALVEGEARPAVDGWCEVFDARLGDPTGLGARLGIDTLRWRGEGLDRLAAATGLPTDLEVAVEGLRSLPATGDPGLDWLLAEQGAAFGIDGHLALGWRERTLRLTAFEMDFPGRSAVRMTATVEGVDLSSMGAAQVSLGSAGLTALTLEATVDGLFESWLLMPLGGALVAGSDDPEALVKGMKAQALAEIERLPADIFPGGTRGAAAGLVAALPHPVGELRLDVAAADRGLGPARFARFALNGVPRAPDELWPALDGVNVWLGWAPLPTEDR